MVRSISGPQHNTHPQHSGAALVISDRRGNLQRFLSSVLHRFWLVSRCFFSFFRCFSFFVSFFSFFFILFFFSLLGNLLEYSSCLFASLCSKIESAPGTRAPPDNDMIPPAAAVVATTIIIINIITDYWDGPGWDNHTVASWPGLPRPFGSWVI